MVTAAVRYFHSPDVPDLARHRPLDPGEFGFLLEVFVGPDDGPGEEAFDLVVCTPTWLANEFATDPLIWGRSHLLVRSYDWAAIEGFVRNRFESVTGPTWRDVAIQIGRYARWEFEDYAS